LYIICSSKNFTQYFDLSKLFVFINKKSDRIAKTSCKKLRLIVMGSEANLIELFYLKLWVLFFSKKDMKSFRLNSWNTRIEWKNWCFEPFKTGYISILPHFLFIYRSNRVLCVRYLTYFKWIRVLYIYILSYQSCKKCGFRWKFSQKAKRIC